jgi:hypothetical protein
MMEWGAKEVLEVDTSEKLLMIGQAESHRMGYSAEVTFTQADNSLKTLFPGSPLSGVTLVRPLNQGVDDGRRHKVSPRELS